MAQIKQIIATQIFDSQSIPTVETTVLLDNGVAASSAVPSDEYKSLSDVVILRDGEQKKHDGLGVINAVNNVNTLIAAALVGTDPANQSVIDNTLITLDGTADKSKLGANAMLSVSQAVAAVAAKNANLSTAAYIRLVSNNQSKKIPTPIFNLIEGGKHSENTLNFQGFLVIPASSRSYSDSLDMGIDIYRSLKKQMKDRGMNTLAADEGGFSPEVGVNRSAFTFLKEAIDGSGITLSLDVFMGLDAAADNFYIDKKYKLIDRVSEYSSGDLLMLYQDLFKEFSVIYFEDAFATSDIDGWQKMFKAMSEKCMIVGDDIIMTNPYRLSHAVENNLIGGIVVKPDQIGTVSEAIAVCEIAKFKNLKIIVSGRCGETQDTFTADFAVGIGADYVKFGAPARERMIKYNRLLELEKEMS